jgi:hypothetical protein
MVGKILLVCGIVVALYSGGPAIATQLAPRIFMLVPSPHMTTITQKSVEKIDIEELGMLFTLGPAEFELYRQQVLELNTKMQGIERYSEQLNQVLQTISSVCSFTLEAIKSSAPSSFGATFQTEEQKRLAVSLLRHLCIQKPSYKTKLTQLINDIGLIGCPETNDQFNISLRALDTCSPASLEKYVKYFTKEHLKHYAIVLNVLRAEETILERKLLTHSIENVIGHLSSTIECVELSGKKYDVILMKAFKKLSTQYPIGED